VPIVGWICPIHRDEVSFDHFDTCNALQGRAAYSPWLARFAAEKILKDTRHLSLDLTATRVLGCPRATYLQTQFSYHVDPSKRALMDRGTALHGVAATMMGDRWGTEHTDLVRMTLVGKLFGHDISAAADAIRKDLGEIVDHKFPSDFSVQYRKKKQGRLRLSDKVGGNYVAQLNIERLLLAQQPWAVEAGYDPGNVLLTVWDHATGSNDPPEPLAVDHVEEDELASFHPSGGDATVVDIVEELTFAKQQEVVPAQTIVEKEQRAASLLLVGETQMDGKKCASYCDVEPACTKLLRKYGRPAIT